VGSSAPPINHTHTPATPVVATIKASHWVASRADIARRDDEDEVH
jgi:hypothetical protein